MGTFRKKPVEIEARQLTDDASAQAIIEWIGTPAGDYGTYVAQFGLVIETLEGEMHASPGDWVVRGVMGEFYPVKPDIFEATYEPV